MRSYRLALLLVALLAARPAAAQGAAQDDREAIDQRLVKVVDFSPKLALAEGDTVFIERRETVAALRVQKKISEYEGVVTAVTAPRGVVVHPRVDEVRLEPAGDKVTVVFRYAVHVDPGATGGGGKLALSLNLVERTGLVNTVVVVKLTQTVNLSPAKPALTELGKDFHGYRLYARLARERMEALTRRGLKGLSIADNAKMPPLDGVPSELMPLVQDFERTRRRTWVAHRHLITARTSKDPAVASAAKAYLANLDKADAEVKGLPLAAGAGGREEPAPRPVETRPPPPSGGGGGAGGTQAVAAYDPSSDSSEEEPPEPARREDPPPEEAVPAVTPVAPAQGGAVAAVAPDDAATLEEDILVGRDVRRRVRIPNAPRGLMIDSTNIGHGARARLAFAGVSRILGTSGIVPALFYGVEGAVNSSLGIEVVVPSVFVNLDLNRARSIYILGNPLISAKYRLILPEVEGRRPVVTPRLRAGIPVPPRQLVPPTPLESDLFASPPHYADPYAFLPEKTNLGLGFSGSYQLSLLAFGVELYGDYFFPTSSAVDRSAFLTLSYGLSAGVLPFGDVLGFYAEARAISTLSGPGRTDLFVYLGARTHFLDYLEIGVWGGLPVGIVSEVSGLQLGTELRFSFDLEDSIELPAETPGGGLAPRAPRSEP